MRIALIGAPGSGKGTQAQLLAKRYRVPHISTGEMLRQAAESDKNFSREARQHIQSGLLVDDDLVRSLLEDRLRQRDTKRGFVIDGYPRNIPQAQALDNLLGMLGRGLQIAVYNQVSEDALKQRNLGRLICAKCGTIYNKFLSPPVTKGVCDQCGGTKLEGRKEDNEKTVATRVERYKEFITPLVTYYRAQHKLRTVSAMGTVEEIHEKICAIVDLEIRPLEIDAMVSATDSWDEGGTTVIAGGKINKVAASAAPRPRKPASKTSPAAAVESGKTKSKKTGTKKTGVRKAGAKKVSVSKAGTKKVQAGKPGEAAAKPAASKTPAKKATAKKATAKKTTTKKAAAKKATAKKTAAKKTGARKAVSKKTAAKKTTAKRSASGKATAKKAATKKTAARKATARKATAKKASAKKASAKKTVAKKAASKKTAAKKSPAKKAPGKKAPSKKAPGKKAAGKKTASKKSSVRKAAPKKKAAVSKPAVKKTGARKAASSKAAASKTTAKKAAAKKRATRKKR